MRVTRWLILCIYVCCATAYANESGEYWGTKKETSCATKNYIVGYGSLVNSESRAATLDTSTVVIPVRVSHEFGYRRSWNYRAPVQFTALGLEKVAAEQADTINGILYPVPQDEIAIWDKREGGYNRVQVPWDMLESLCWVSLPTQGTAWIYVPKENYAKYPDAKYPIVQSYVDTTVEGFLEYSEGFATEFLETTYDWNASWLNDRLMARRPWVHNQASSRVDKLLRAHPEDDRRNHFEFRSYMVTH